MSNCPTCKESILSQTPSLIGQTQCTQTCPPDITCVDIIPSNCVFYSGPTLSCPSGNTSVNYGVTITEALNTMYQLLCQNSTSNTVQITANDTCYGFLASKITSTSLDITIANPGACEKLNIEEGCPVWNNVLNSNSGDGRFLNSWTNADPTFLTIQRVQYSNVKGCSIKLRGSITRTKLWDGNSFVVFVLPNGFRPLKLRWFHATVDSAGSGLVPLTILIKPNGEVEITADPFTLALGVTTSFDGIEFEIN
jgi:hypothetical protein